MDRRIAKITLYEPMDADKLQSWLDAGDNLVIDVDRSYPMANVPAGLVGVFPVQFAPAGSLYATALKNVLAAATWVHAAGGVFLKVKASSTRVFTVDGYVWAADDITVKSAVADGTVLMAEFTTPGLPAYVKTTISLPYNQAISGADFLAMNDVGLTLQAGGTGNNFRVVGKSAFTVRFFQPGDSAVNYIVDFDKENQIIQ